jgi:hypothetical protein
MEIIAQALPWLAVVFGWLIVGLLALFAIDEFADDPVTSDWPPLFVIAFWPIFVAAQIMVCVIVTAYSWRNRE